MGRMAILSAHSRRHSPTSTAELSPTLEQQFDSIDIQDPDEKIKSVDIDTEDTEHESAVEENSAEAEARLSFHSTCVTEVNMMIENTPEEEEEEEESDLNGSSKQVDIEKETSELDTELVSKMEDDRRQDVVTHLEILVSKETKKLDNFPSEMEQHARSKPQALRKVFRGDSRDSGIGDCSSGQVTFSLQVDEQGIVSITEEETDHETHTRENKRTLMEEEEKRNLTKEILTSSSTQGEDVSSHVTESITDDGKVASTKSDVTKASCETNSVRKGV